MLFLLQQPLSRRLVRRAPEEQDFRSVLPRPSWWLIAGQFGVAVYGGYFGAGIGILMLATLGAMGLTNIHRMNGIKNWGAMCINATAAITFVLSGIVTWPVAIAMAAGGLAGGYGGARLALRVGQKWVRRAVIAIGFLAFIWLVASRSLELSASSFQFASSPAIPPPTAVSTPSFLTPRRIGRGAPCFGSVTSTHSSSPAARIEGSLMCSGMKNARGGSSCAVCRPSRKTVRRSRESQTVADRVRP